MSNWPISKWLLCLLGVLVLSGTTHATPPELLKLKWGLLISEFRNMDVVIEEEWPMWKRATGMRVKDQTQTFPEPGSLNLVFDNDFGLVITHWASKPIERDENGSKGLKSFEQFKATLFQQYGTPQEIHQHPGLKLQGFHGNFYQCLLDETCGPWESIWETPEGEVLILELIGLDPGVGFIQLTRQGPNLQDTLRLAHPGLDMVEHEI